MHSTYGKVFETVFQQHISLEQGGALQLFLVLTATTRDTIPPYSGYPAVDDIGCAATALIRPYVDGTNRTVCGTGATFHTTIMVNNRGLFAIHLKDAMRTYSYTISAADAYLMVEFEYSSIVKISESFHNR